MPTGVIARPTHRSVIEDRREQMFPVLEPAEIERVRRFGERRSYSAGEALVRVGEVGHGQIVVLAGEVAVTRHDELGRREAIVTHGPGGFFGRARAALRPPRAGRRSTRRRRSRRSSFAPQKLRALLVAEAELGERIMRALILRRVGLLESGERRADRSSAAPDDGDVLRLEDFLAPQRPPAPAARSRDRRRRAALFCNASTSSAASCRSCSVRAGSCCAIRARASSARCLGLVAPLDPDAGSTTSRSSAPGRRVSPPRSMPRPKDSR